MRNRHHLTRPAHPPAGRFPAVPLTFLEAALGVFFASLLLLAAGAQEPEWRPSEQVMQIMIKPHLEEWSRLPVKKEDRDALLTEFRQNWPLWLENWEKLEAASSNPQAFGAIVAGASRTLQADEYFRFFDALIGAAERGAVGSDFLFSEVIGEDAKRAFFASRYEDPRVIQIAHRMIALAKKNGHAETEPFMQRLLRGWILEDGAEAVDIVLRKEAPPPLGWHGALRKSTEIGNPEITPVIKAVLDQAEAEGFINRKLLRTLPEWLDPVWDVIDILKFYFPFWSRFCGWAVLGGVALALAKMTRKRLQKQPVSSGN